MKTLISGQAGLGIVKLGDQFRLITNETSPNGISVSSTEVLSVLRNQNDLTEYEVASMKDVVKQIEVRQSSDRAMLMAIILLDKDEPNDIRRKAANCLNELLMSEAVVTYVANRLYSAPMPDNGDIEGAIEFCDEDSEPQRFFNELLYYQQEIAERWKAWEELSVQLFGSLKDKRWFHAVAVREGAFRLFVRERDKGDWALFQMLSHPEFRGNPKARKVFQSWHETFRTVYTPDPTAFSEEYTDLPDPNFQSPISAHEAFKSAEAQRATIKKLLLEDRLHQALRYTDELILSQRQISQPVHLAKSLCDLAQFAKECGSPELQLTFAQKATQEAPEDAWALATLGDAYRGVYEYQQALDAFQRSVVFGNNLAGHLGRAEVLKDLGQIDEALELFEFCIREFSGDVVAFNSRASALAEFGRFDEALSAYNEILAEHPYEHVTRSGRAQLLRMMGNLSEALEEFSTLVHEFPEEVISSCARSEVIRDLGDFERAELEMRSLIEKFPSESSPQIGHARILCDLGRFEEAIVAFEKVVSLHPLDMAGLIGKADTYRKIGELDQAKNTYQKVIDRIESDRLVRLGLASVYVAQSEYDTALDLLPDRFPATKGEWIAFHIRGMAFLRRGEYSRAQKMFEWGVNNCPWGEQKEYFATALATCRIREGRSLEAVQFVEKVSSVSVIPISRAIGMHAYAELGDDNGFRDSYDAIPVTSSPVVLRLRDSIFSHYMSVEGTQISDEQLFADEWNSLVIAA